MELTFHTLQGKSISERRKGGHLFEGQVLSSNNHTVPTLPALVLQKDAASQLLFITWR
jgi:hypothetical protein